MRVRVLEYVRLLLSALSHNTHDYGIRLYQRGGSPFFRACVLQQFDSSFDMTCNVNQKRRC